MKKLSILAVAAALTATTTVPVAADTETLVDPSVLIIPDQPKRVDPVFGKIPPLAAVGAFTSVLILGIAFSSSDGTS